MSIWGRIRSELSNPRVHPRLNTNRSLTPHLCYILGFGKKVCQANIQIIQTKGSLESVYPSTPQLLSRESICPTVFLPIYTLLCTATVITLNPLCVTYANVIFCTVFESSIIHAGLSNRKLYACGAGTQSGFSNMPNECPNWWITVSFLNLDSVANKTIEQNSYSIQRFHGVGDVHKE